MRIQHNIMAMNAYRNYTNNTSAVAKNLEKLSSGYRINRAGDDAAGLAISEKMRAQITGLSAAQKNVKDGLSLVKTAEGATQEIHDMLNRMVYLAEQSSNGTYQDAVDRDAIQNEFNALKKEIDRIADSSNFNGIKLLDGSLEDGKAAASGLSAGDFTFKLSEKAMNDAALTYTQATKSSGSTDGIKFTAAGAAAAEGGTVSVVAAYTDESGNKQSLSITLTVNAAKDKLVAEDGTEYDITSTGPTKNQLSKAVAAELNKSDLGKLYTFTDDKTDKVTSEAKTAGSKGGSIEALMVQVDTAKAGTPTMKLTDSAAAGKDGYNSLDITKLEVWDGKGDASEKAFSINGQSFVFTNGVSDEQIAALEKDGIIALTAAATTPAGADDGAAAATRISNALGVKVELNGNKLDFKPENKVSAGSASGGLVLQIGDTSEDFNQLTVSIADMHSKALGIAGLDLNTQSGAQAAVQTIKDAINKVSSTRGELGATQNRLEHTQNNLSVMKENIQDAEANIRDTDIAEEMMSYTKNNILVQSAQAMLAQANQIPQGVLQLLG